MTRRTLRPAGPVLIGLHSGRLVVLVIGRAPPGRPRRRHFGPPRVAACLAGMVCLLVGGCWL